MRSLLLHYTVWVQSTASEFGQKPDPQHFRFLDADLLEQMLGAVVEEGEGVVIGVEQSCPALTRFLSLAGKFMLGPFGTPYNN